MTTEPKTSLFDALKPLAGRALELALNRLLSLDSDTQASLESLDGKRISLHLESPTMAMEISVANTQLKVGPAQNEEADLGVRSNLSGVLSQLPFFRNSQHSPSGKVRIQGDAELAQRLQKLAQTFDPDWEKPFIDVFGVIIGVQVAKAAREAFQQTRHVAKKFAHDSADFLTEESRDVVSSAEIDAFNDDVDDLRDRAERLMAKLAKLQVHAEPSA
jgi:ubiquinone biosynthesis accessory factor UbiJ